MDAHLDILREAMEGKQMKLLESRISKSVPHTNRASQIGHPCNRFLFYERKEPGMAVLHDYVLQAIFDLGHALQRYVARRFDEMGIDVTQQERDFYNDEYDLSGHVDFRIRIPGFNEEKDFPVESKGLNSFATDSIETIDDIKNHKNHHIRRYYSQLQAYLFFGNDEFGFFVLLNKTTGLLKFIPCPRDEEHIHELLSRSSTVKLAVLSDEPPERNLGSYCDTCPYMKTICLPDREFGPGVDIIDDPETIALLDRRAKIKPMFQQLKKMMDEIDDEVAVRIPKLPEVLVGNHIVIGKERTREGFTVSPSKWWERRYKMVTSEEEKNNE